MPGMRKRNGVHRKDARRKCTGAVVQRRAGDVITSYQQRDLHRAGACLREEALQAKL